MVSQGKSLPPYKSTENANDDSVSEKDPIFGMHKMTPSQIIAQIISAMDDQLDDRRPQFSSSADVGALVIIVGFSDMTKNLPSLGGAIEALVQFFGGDNGLLTKGMQQIGTLATAALGQLEDPSKHNVKFKVEDITGVRGTTTDKETLKGVGIDYNFNKMFEVGDLLLGHVQNLVQEQWGMFLRLKMRLQWKMIQKPHVMNLRYIKLRKLQSLVHLNWIILHLLT